MNKLYTVSDAGNGLLKVTDVETGALAGTISAKGSNVTGLVVMGNQVSYVCTTTDGTKLGCIHQLPSGQLIKQFTG